MPTYDYKCSKCGRIFEVFQGMSDDKLTTCSECGGSVERLIGAGAGIIFKGSGFYCTDYRSNTYQKGASSDASHTSVPSSDTTKKAKKKEPATSA